MDPAPGLALVIVSPRVAPGLMSRSAWQVVEAARVRLCADADEPLAVAVTDADLPIQVYAVGSPALLARHLVERAADDNVVWLGSADGDEGLSDAIADEVSRLNDPPPVEVVVGSWDVPGARLLDVVAVMDRQGAPGVPFDVEGSGYGFRVLQRLDAEQQALGLGAGEIGALLMTAWGLPAPIVAADGMNGSSSPGLSILMIEAAATCGSSAPSTCSRENPTFLPGPR